MNGTEDWPLLMAASLRQKSIFVTHRNLPRRTHRYNRAQLKNVQLIGFLQVMRATCHGRRVKSTDPRKGPRTNRLASTGEKFMGSYFLFIVMTEKGDAAPAVA